MVHRFICDLRAADASRESAGPAESFSGAHRASITLYEVSAVYSNRKRRPFRARGAPYTLVAVNTGQRVNLTRRKFHARSQASPEVAAPRHSDDGSIVRKFPRERF